MSKFERVFSRLRPLLGIIAVCLLVTIFSAAAPVPAFAESCGGSGERACTDNETITVTGHTRSRVGLGDVICTAVSGMGVYANFISAVAFVAGIFFLAQGAFMLRKHYDNPNDAPLSRVFMHMIGGGALIALPITASMLISTFVGSITETNGAVACTPIAATMVTSTRAGVSGDQLFSNLFNNISDPIETLLSGMSLVIGAFFICKGLLKASKFGADQKATTHSILANLVFGAFILAIGQSLDMVLTSLFGTGSGGIQHFEGLVWDNLSSSTSDGMTKTDAAVKSVFMFIQVIGMISFLRGWLVLKSAVEGNGQATIPQGVTHIVGGAMAVNIGGLTQILFNSMGISQVIKIGS